MKLYIDSRKRISGSPSNFVYQLPETLDIPESVAYVDVVLVPNVFYTIRAGYNDRLYIREVATVLPPISQIWRAAFIEPGSYNGFTLATAVQNALNTGRILSPSFNVSYNTQTSKLEVSANLAGVEHFEIFPTGWMKENWAYWNAESGYDVDPSHLQDAGAACGFTGDSVVYYSALSSSPIIGQSSINVMSHHSLFIHSNLGGLGDSWGPNGENDIIRRVCMESSQGDITIDRHTSPYDNVKMLRQSLRNIQFRLTDVDNREVDLQGHNYSFSIIINEQ